MDTPELSLEACVGISNTAASQLPEEQPSYT